MLAGRRVPAGRSVGQWRSRATRLVGRVRRLSHLYAGRRLPAHRLERLRPPRAAVHAPVPRRREPVAVDPGRRVGVDGLGPTDQDAPGGAAGRGARLHRAAQRRPRRAGDAARRVASASARRPAAGRPAAWMLWRFLERVERQRARPTSTRRWARTRGRCAARAWRCDLAICSRPLATSRASTRCCAAARTCCWCTCWRLTSSTRRPT